MLDAFIVPNNAIDRVDLTRPLVTVTTGTTSDHFLVTAIVKFEALKSTKLYIETVRIVKDIDNKLFIENIELFDVVKKVCNSSTVDEAVQQFSNLMALVTDKHAPKIKGRLRLNKTRWWDAQCQEMRRERRRAERSLRKRKSQSNKSIYLAEVESSRTSLASRTDFEVLGLGLGLEASSPRKLTCPRLEDSTIF